MSHNARIKEGFKEMNEGYKKIIDLEDYYKSMKKKYPHLKMWDDLLDLLKKHKKGFFLAIDKEN